MAQANFRGNCFHTINEELNLVTQRTGFTEFSLPDMNLTRGQPERKKNNKTLRGKIPTGDLQNPK